MSKVKPNDDDNPPLTERQLTKMRPAREVVPEVVKAARGRPRLVAPKQLVSLRLDADVLAHFRMKGEGWQSRINDTLRKAAKLRQADKTARK